LHKTIIAKTHHAVQALPITIAFARITYSHPTFNQVQPQLSRLLIASNATHAFVGALLSRLPFAVAQVQDLGLIFLNAMTTDVAHRLQGQPQEVIVGTAMVACSIATMLLGLVLIIVGKYAC
jgi:sulfate permease, SulP family